MRTRIEKRILAVLLSAVIAICAGGAAQAEEEAVILEETEGLLTVAEEPGDLSGSDILGADSLSQETSGPPGGAPDLSGEETEDEQSGTESAAGPASGQEDETSQETESFDLADPGSSGAPVEIISMEEVPAELSDGTDPGEVQNEILKGDSSGEEPVLDDGITYLEERTVAGGDAANAAASRIFMRSLFTYECCYGDQLVGEGRKIYDALVDSWAAGNTENVVYDLEEDLTDTKENRQLISKNAEMAYCAFAYDYPEVFWLRSATIMIGSPASSKKTPLTKILLAGNERYEGAKSEVGEFARAVEKETDIIKGLLPENADRYTIVKTIHDYICNTVSYGDDKGNYPDNGNGEVFGTAHTAAGVFLKDRVVVCEGYAKAFKILCSQFGIDCALIVGDAGEAHMWNYVKMDDGKWYLVDTTWDDQAGGITDTYLLAGSLTYGFHGSPILAERIIWTDFSGSGAKNFVVPVLSAQKYENIQHRWKEVSSLEGTCRSYATADYICEDCGLTKTEIVGPETGHVWGPYVSNNDATCLSDGTKTAGCLYGCGETNTVPDAGSRLAATLEVNVQSLCLKVKQSTSAAKVTLARGDKVASWKSNKPSVASVNDKGKITAGTKTGKAVITLKTLSGLTGKIKVTVQKKTVETTGITGLSKKVTLKKGKKLQLSPVIEPVTSQQKVTYVSSDKKTASVTAKGVVTAKKTGTAKIKVKSGKKTFTVTVKVKK